MGCYVVVRQACALRMGHIVERVHGWLQRLRRRPPVVVHAAPAEQLKLLPPPLEPQPLRCLPLLADEGLAFLATIMGGHSVAFSGWEVSRIINATLLGLELGLPGIRALASDRPEGLDQALLEQGEALGLGAEVRAFLARHGTGRDTGPASEYHLTDTADCWWVRASLEHPDIRQRLDAPEIVVDFGTLFHEADPRRRILRLAELRPRLLVLDTLIIDETRLPEGSPFTAASAWYVAAMTPEQTRLMADYWRAIQPCPAQFDLLPHGGTREDFRRAGLDALWWWFMGREAVRGMLLDAGYRVISVTPSWGGRSAIFTAEAVA